MGTASTMNAVAEALGMSLARLRGDPRAVSRARADGLSHRPADRGDGLRRPAPVDDPDARGVPQRHRDRSACGGSSNAQPHIAAMARHAGVELAPEEWQQHGYDLPLLVNMQPAGKYLGERFHRAGGVPAVDGELLQAGRLDGELLTVHRANAWPRISQGREATGSRDDPAFAIPLKERAGFLRPAGQSVRLRDPEDLGDLGRVPRALSFAAGAGGVFEGAGHRVRRIGRLSPPHQRPGARASTRTASW